MASKFQICKEKGCRRKVKKGKICYKCKSKRYKQSKPWRYVFNYHKQNARRRLKNLPYSERWGLSFEEFLSVWNNEPKKKKEKESSIRSGSVCLWEIDRIDSEKGYQSGNVRIVTKSVNLQLYWMFKKGMIGEEFIQVYRQGFDDGEESLEDLAPF